MPHFTTIPRENWRRAREMRQQPTEAEKKLWKAIRDQRFQSPFRREHPIGTYIADFVCLERKLVIELDGGGHAENAQAEHDRVRDEAMMAWGFRVLRYSNLDVMQNLSGIIQNILDNLNDSA